MRFKFDPVENASCQSLAEEGKKAAEAAGSPEELIFAWLSQRNRQVEIFPAVDDDTNQDVVVFRFKEGDVEAGAAWADEAEIYEACPALEPVSNSLLPEAQHESLDFEERRRLMDEGFCDEGWFEAQDGKLDVKWNEELMTNTLNKKNGVLMALSYAIARNGHAIIEFRHLAEEQDLYDDLDVRQINGGNFFHLLVNYSHEKNGLGFGADYVIL